ncbi:unnamed protein product [Lupinus luteus]|uniref:Uncharacterized protein n=1 Tax=Lupinus luteus TaxID=3873 RepID=A0AAV1WUL6_LUPLU
MERVREGDIGIVLGSARFGVYSLQWVITNGQRNLYIGRAKDWSLLFELAIEPIWRHMNLPIFENVASSHGRVVAEVRGRTTSTMDIMQNGIHAQRQSKFAWWKGRAEGVGGIVATLSTPITIQPYKFNVELAKLHTKCKIRPPPSFALLNNL